MSLAEGLLASFLLATGALIAAMWAALVLGAKVPELRDGRKRLIVHHIAAEALTAALLMAGGLAMVLGYGTRMALVPLGMLLYTTINSVGHYAQEEKGMMSWAFYALASLTVVAMFLAL